MSALTKLKKEWCKRKYDEGPPTEPLWAGAKLGPSNILGVAPGVKVIAGRATGEEALVFFVRRKESDPTKILATSFIPPAFGEIPTDLVEVDAFRALQVECGMGIGPPKGTGGCVVEGVLAGEKDRGRFLLSAGHVLAPDGRWNLTDEIHWAPRSVTSTPTNTLLGHTAVIAELRRDPELMIDAGLVRLDGSVEVSPDIICHRTRTLPNVTGDARTGQPVWKCGASTGFTQGKVLCVNGCFWVEVPSHPEKWVFLRHQLVLDSEPGKPVFAGPGDSGSVVVADGESPRVAGLLVAGSLPTGLFLANPIGEVLKQMGTGWQIDS